MRLQYHIQCSSCLRFLPLAWSPARDRGHSWTITAAEALLALMTA